MDTQQSKDLQTLRTRDMMTLMRAMIPAQEQLLIVSPPGSGKTSMYGQVAAEIDYDLILFHPAVDEPVDYKGLPGFDSDHRAEFHPYGNLRVLLETDRPTLAVFDDFGQADESVQKATMQLLGSRELNGMRVSDSVVFGAATNDKGQRAGVRGLLEPVKSRFDCIQHLDIHVDDWTEWALQSGNVPEELIAFINHRPDFLTAWEPNAELLNTPNPRSIVKAGSKIRLGLPTGIEQSAMAGAAGGAFAQEFAGFMQVYRNLPNPKLTLQKPDQAKLPTDDAMTMYAMTASCTAHADKKTADGYFRLLGRLCEEGVAEYAVLGVKMVNQRSSDLFNTSAYINFLDKYSDIFD